MAKAEASVEELVSMIERGELRLPEMQRQYVWRSTRVRDLLDSLYRGYPSGAILLWETDETVPLQEFAVSQQRNPYQSTRLLLDGQQRLTSLSAVIRGEHVKVRGRMRPIELLFNLEHPDQPAFVTEVNEEASDDEDIIEDEADSTEDELQRRFDKMTFVVATRKLGQLPHWVRVSEVFKTDEDAPFLSRAGIEKISDPRYTKYSQRLARLRAIRRYMYRMDVLERSLSYDEVTEIFVRVNSLGAKLRSSDLALAQITAKWRNSLSTFQAFQHQCAKTGFDLDLGLYLKNMIAFATGQSRFLTVGSLSLEELQSAWKESCRGMEFAMNFLKSNAGIDSPALLSSPFLLVALAYFGHKRDYHISPEESDHLRFWVLVANAKGRFSRGSSETILDQDLATLRDGGGTQELIDRIRLQVGRLDVTPEELEGRNQRSALFKTMFLAFRASGAKDWRSNLAIALDHSGAQHRLQFHHIFPKAVLKNAYNDPEWMNGNYTTQPRSLQFASVFYGIATNGGNQALYKAAPTREKADALLNQRLSAPFRGDANDHLYQWEASRDYNASSGLERIQAALLAINSADDERNPPELGVLDREIKRVKHGRVLLIPGSDQTAGHGTTARARFWKQNLAELLHSAPRRAK